MDGGLHCTCWDQAPAEDWLQRAEGELCTVALVLALAIVVVVVVIAVVVFVAAVVSDREAGPCMHSCKDCGGHPHVEGLLGKDDGGWGGIFLPPCSAQCQSGGEVRWYGVLCPNCGRIPKQYVGQQLTLNAVSGLLQLRQGNI
eukprot:822494-Pelagomonas_calceolata.AAC.10